MPAMNLPSLSPSLPTRNTPTPTHSPPLTPCTEVTSLVLTAVAVAGRKQWF